MSCATKRRLPHLRERPPAPRALLGPRELMRQLLKKGPMNSAALIQFQSFGRLLRDAPLPSEADSVLDADFEVEEGVPSDLGESGKSCDEDEFLGGLGIGGMGA